MTKFQWNVVIAICKILIDIKQDYLHLSSVEDLNLLHTAIYNNDMKIEIND